MANFYTDVIAQQAEFSSTKRIDSLDLLEPATRAAVMAIIEDARTQGLELMVFETYRSRERQALLFEQGATKLRTVGVHHYGLACDLVKNIGGEPSWKGSFEFLGPLAQTHGLIWGGNWGTPGQPHSFIDADHVQRCSVARQADLFAGRWYPDAKYNPYK